MTQTSREYAVALFTLAKESGLEDEIAQSLSEISKIFKENPEYVAFLQTPGIPKKERINAADELLTGRAPEYAVSFVLLLIDKGLLKIFDKCVYEYNSLYQTVTNMSVAEVLSAVPLTDDEKETLKLKLKKACGHEVALDCTVDKSIIGGVVVKVDGKVYDGSVKQHLNDVKEVMYE